MLKIQIFVKKSQFSSKIQIFVKNAKHFTKIFLSQNSLERREFADRLAKQNSVLVSLGNVQNGNGEIPEDRKMQTGTLEGLEELHEAIQENLEKAEKSEEISKLEISKSEDISKSELSKTDSIFSDASKSEEEIGISENSSMSEKSENVTQNTETKTETPEKTYTEEFDETGSFSAGWGLKNTTRGLLYKI